MGHPSSGILQVMEELRYVSSTSIFFAAGSSFVTRKLRTCPALKSDFAAAVTAPDFHLAASMDVREFKSAAPVAWFAEGPLAGSNPSLQIARMPSPSSTVAKLP